MGWRGVPHARAKELGLLDNWTPPLPGPLSSPNESLETRPEITSRELRSQLAGHLQGLAEWKGDTLVFTDPNGTRPMAAPKLIEAWSRGMPEKFHDLPGKGMVSRHALKLWSENHDAFTRELDPQTGRDLKPAPGRLDLFDDLWRLFNRLPAMPAAKPVFRGLAWNDAGKFNAFVADLEQSGFYLPRPNKPADSWSVAASGARKYARRKPYGVTLICENHASAKDLSELLRSMQGELSNPDPAHPLVTDGEVVFAKGARFEVLRIERGNQTAKGGTATIYVRQL